MAGGARRNTGGPRVGAGRPRLSDEEKARRKALRQAGLMPPGRKPKPVFPEVEAAKAMKEAEAAAAAEAANLTPLDYMLQVMRDRGADSARRDRMALAAAQFLHQRRDTPLAKKGKKELENETAQAANQGGRFGTPPPPRLSVVGSK